MVAIAQQGIHFDKPWLMMPVTSLAAQLSIYDANNSSHTSATVAFFTGLATEGVQDTTNWTLNTYKTIYSHTGQGLIAGMIACTAGGAETTTFEITIDGVLSTITVTNANGERAALLCGFGRDGTDFTTANVFFNASTAAGAIFDAGTNSTYQSGTMTMLPFHWLETIGRPLLRYNTSALVRMKHSATITNSTATAYSAVMVRKGIAA